ncbi:hypothetical protein EG329_000031 [Mollisiaceae sp. DMI_Dod_QoI]|nr:hypothetical protein EG329_000031 [Helotiales sp. DMI_Dod_QoI]
MRSSIVLGSLCAALALASPIHKAVQKKDYIWDITTKIVYVTVTEGELPATTSTSIPPVVTVHTTVTEYPEAHKSHTSVHAAPPMHTTTLISIPPPAPSTTSTTPAPAPTTSTEAAPVVESTVVAKVSASSAAAVASPTDYQSTAIYHHAKHRANHSAGALEWDDTLAGYALLTAKTCVFAHDMTEGGGGYGQNLAAYGTTGDIASLDTATLVADAITNQWYYGEAANVPYGQNSPAVENVPEFLHFTALVWKASTKVGCATVQCGAGTIFSYHSLYTVCDYSSEGNVLGEFASEVAKPIGLPAITAAIS